MQTLGMYTCHSARSCEKERSPTSGFSAVAYLFMDYFNSYNTKKESPIHPPTAEYFPIFFGPPLLTVQRINRHGAFPIGARHELSEDKTNLAS